MTNYLVKPVENCHSHISAAHNDEFRVIGTILLSPLQTQCPLSGSLKKTKYEQDIQLINHTSSVLVTAISSSVGGPHATISSRLFTHIHRILKAH